MTKLKWPLNPAYQLAICATLPTPPPKWCSHIFCFPLKPPTSFLLLLLADDLASHFTRKIKSISKVYPQAPTAETHLFAPVPMSSTSLPVTKDELSVLLSNPLPAHTHAPTHTHSHTRFHPFSLIHGHHFNNSSLSDGSFPSAYKHKLQFLHLKTFQGLHFPLQSHPISLLPFT